MKLRATLKEITFSCLLLSACILMLSPALLHADVVQKGVRKGPAIAKNVEGAPVIFNGQTLFSVRSKLHSFPPESRAKLIAGRIEKLAKDPLQKTASITISDNERTTDIVIGDLTLMTLTDDDAKAAGKPRSVVAEEYAGIIRTAIDAERSEYGVRTLLFGALYAFLATAVFLVLLSLIKRLFPGIQKKLYAWKDVRIHALRVQNFEILSSEKVVLSFVKLASIVRLALLIVLFYFYVPLVLSFFPWTRGYSAELFEYFVVPFHTVGHALLAYIPNFIFLLVIVAITYYGLKVIRLLFNALERRYILLPGFYPEWSLPTYKIARFLVIAVAIVAAFPYLPGAGSPAFQGVSVFIGVLLSFGSAGAVSNIVAGVILTYMRPFKIGDRVRIADTSGDIIEKTLLVTRIRTIKNEDISVPNSMVLGSHIINYSTSAKDLGLILHTTVTIGYDAPWRKVHELLIAAALSTESILKDRKPFVLQTGLDDFFVRYQLNAYTDQPNRMAVTYAELHQNIQDKFNESGVEIMSPHYSSLRDGNKATIPDEYLDKGYTSPGFTITGLRNTIGLKNKPRQETTDE